METMIQIIIEKYFKTKKSIFLVSTICFILGIVTCYPIDNYIYKIIIWIALTMIDLFYIVETIKYNKLPKNKLDDAILLRIIAKDKNEYDDIVFKFVNEFKKNFTDNKINVIPIPYHLVERCNYDEQEKIISLLKKTNCIFIVTVKTRSEEIKENTKYITEINMGIIHPTYQKKIENMFQNEVDLLGMPTSKIVYKNENKLEILEFTAQRLSMVCKYIIARANFLNCNFDNSIVIGEDLYKEIKNISEKSFQSIKQCTYNLCYDVHIIKMLLENSKANPNIDIIEKELNLANDYIKNTYTYYEGMSVCCFLKYRDIKKTKDYLGNCKKIEKNAPWKYSEAFLKAYCNESEGRIIYSYKQAFKIQYEHMNLIYFIEDILQKEPDKNMLRFALVLLYAKLEETKTAREILLEYLKNKESHILDENTIKQLNKVLNENILNEIL